VSRIGKKGCTGGDAGEIRATTEAERIQGQIDRGEVDASEDAARLIAQRIEDEGGFWGKRKK
jgi:hypothetical protein